MADKILGGFPFSGKIFKSMKGCSGRIVTGRVFHGKGSSLFPEEAKKDIPLSIATIEDEVFCKLWGGKLPRSEAFEVHLIGSAEERIGVCASKCLYGCFG